MQLIGNSRYIVTLEWKPNRASLGHEISKLGSSMSDEETKAELERLRKENAAAPKPIEALDNFILMVEARNESSRFPDGATVSWPRWSIPC
jgi:hypothetical protein